MLYGGLLYYVVVLYDVFHGPSISTHQNTFLLFKNLHSLPIVVTFPNCFQIAHKNIFEPSFIRLLAYVIQHVPAFVFSLLSNKILLAMFCFNIDRDTHSMSNIFPWLFANMLSQPVQFREHSAHTTFFTQMLCTLPLHSFTLHFSRPFDSTWILRQLFSLIFLFHFVLKFVSALFLSIILQYIIKCVFQKFYLPRGTVLLGESHAAFACRHSRDTSNVWESGLQKTSRKPCSKHVQRTIFPSAPTCADDDIWANLATCETTSMERVLARGQRADGCGHMTALLKLFGNEAESFDSRRP